MATYDYQCDDCESVQEEMHPMSGPTYAIKCQKCGSKKMNKVMLEAPYSIFNGEGWCTNEDRGIDKG